jgi:succinoglycan biosynthesis protein ExoA
VVIPCYNEERFIGKALENLVQQYDKERYEIIVVDGQSLDRTREVIAEFVRMHPELSVSVLDNPARTIPHALNLGIEQARGEIIVRMDAHAMPSPGYIRRCVQLLRGGEAAVVGMPCRVCPGSDTLMARAIARAVSHPFGIGDAKYRLGGGKALQEAVDTVAFASFNKRLWRNLGGFNEELLTNEDYDFNYRVRASGERVLLDRSEHCDYFARTTLRELAAQYLRYGAWKARMVRLHPLSIKWRQVVAPLFLASIVFFAVTGFWWQPAWLLLALELAIYLLMAFAFAWQIVRKEGAGRSMILMLPLAFFTIHIMWGIGFFLGLMRSQR